LGLAAERGGSAVNPSEVAECSFHGGLLSVVMYGTQDNREGPKPFVVRGCNPLPFVLPFLLGGGSLFARSDVRSGGGMEGCVLARPTPPPPPPFQVACSLSPSHVSHHTLPQQSEYRISCLACAELCRSMFCGARGTVTAARSSGSSRGGTQTLSRCTLRYDTSPTPLVPRVPLAPMYLHPFVPVVHLVPFTRKISTITLSTITLSTITLLG
jgi:hypothetical protein